MKKHSLLSVGLAVTLLMGTVVPVNVMGASGAEETEVKQEFQNLALNTSGTGYPKAFADYTNGGDKLEHLVDGVISGKEGAPHDEGPRNRWTNYDHTGDAYIGSEFESEQEVHRIEVFAFNDGGGVPTPVSMEAEYWNGTDWETMAGQKVKQEDYPQDEKIEYFEITFDQVTTSKVRIHLQSQPEKSVGVSEMNIWGTEKLLYGFKISAPSVVPQDNIVPVNMVLENVPEQSQKVYLKVADGLGKEKTQVEEISAGVKEQEISVNTEGMNEGNLTITVSLNQDYSEAKQVVVKKNISSEVIQNIYEEVKTPYEYGIVLEYSGQGSGEFDSDLIDNPNVFTIPGDDKYVYMTYVGHDGSGYRTGMARSEDLLTWEKIGKVLDNGEPGAWDEYNAAGYIVKDHNWGEMPTPHRTKDGKYAMTYLASDEPGYEAGIKRAGVAFANKILNDDGTVAQWNRYPDPVLDASNGEYPYESGTIWKLQAVWDNERQRYVGFYNASTGPEVMCQAYSEDLINWQREEKNPVLNKDVSPSGENWGDSHNADADVVRIGDYWVMFYFTSSPGGIIDSFAVSKDMVNWTKSYLPLTKRNDTYSSTYAHKPCVFKKNGVVYHFYNAVGTEGRLIALDTSIDLTAVKKAQEINPDDCSGSWYQGLQERLKNAQTALRKEGGSLKEVEEAIQKLNAYMEDETDEILHYEMKTGEGNTVADSTGNYPGSLCGETKWEKGLNGMAVRLMGGEDYIQIPKEAFLQSEEVAFSMWVNPERVETWTTLMTAGNSTDNYAVLAAQGTPFGTPVGLTMAIKENGGQEYRIAADPSVTLPENKWSLVTYMQKGTHAELYLNAEKVAETEEMNGTLKGVLEASDEAQVRVGDNMMFPDPSLYGTISEIKLMSRKLTEEEILKEVEAKQEKITYMELEAAADAIDLGDLSGVMDDLDLPESSNGIKIRWMSDDESIIASDGTVTLPSEEQGDKTVTLTAVLTSEDGSVTVERKFPVVVLAATDERIIEKASDYTKRYMDYIINDGYELLTDEKTGCHIEWTLTEGEAAIKDGTVVKTAASKERQPIKLKATLTKGNETREISFENITLLDSYAGYILSFFGGEDGQEKLHLGYSYDGIHWEKLNGGNTVLETTIGNGRVRDPFILRKKDGSFGIVATQGWDTPQIYLWDSEDLVSFTNERLKTVSYPDVAGLTGQRAWAPEASYDPLKDEYIVYWSDPSANNGNGCTYANTSKDLENFSQPFVLFDAGYTMIDANITKWNGTYYMVFKDERGNNADGGGGKKILMAKSKSLEPGTFEQYTGPITDTLVEGPFMFKVNGEEKWYHYYDYFNEHKFGVSVTSDLDSGMWEFLGKSTTMPTEDVRHGGVVPVTEKELSRILEGYQQSETILSIEQPGEVAVEYGTAFDKLLLPTTVKVQVKAGQKDVSVTWEKGDYDAKTPGTYMLKGILDESYTVAEGVVPTIKVTVKDQVKVDKSQLQEYYDANKGKKAEDYKAGFENYEKALLEAERVLNNPKASQEEVDNALRELQEAVKNLVPIDAQQPDSGDSKPSEPVKPGTSSSQLENKKAAKTGDTATVIWALGIMVGVIGVTGIWYRRRQRKA